MNDVGLGELLLRMLISLAVVLAVVMAAYVLIRRRQGQGAVPRRGRRVGSLVSARGRGGASSSSPRRSGLRIVGRVGVGRTSSVVAVQFADRVFMIGASEQGTPAVLAELELDEWNRATQQPEEASPLPRRGAPSGGGEGDQAHGARPGFLDALREATVRRG